MSFHLQLLSVTINLFFIHEHGYLHEPRFFHKVETFQAPKTESWYLIQREHAALSLMINCAVQKTDTNGQKVTIFSNKYI